MAIGHALVGEFDMEAASTRRIVERVPDIQNTWQPHAKSYTFGSLATHIVELHKWPSSVLGATELDLAMYKPAPYDGTAELLQRLDKYAAESRAAMAQASDEDYMVPWSLRAGPTVFFTMPRIQVLRGMVFNHFIHHRGQLSVYLRQLDIPVPGLYGPSADER